VEITGDDIAPLVKDNNVLQLEKAGALSWLALMFPVFLWVLLINDWRLPALYHFSAATIFRPEANTSAFGLGIGFSMLEPGTKWLLLDSPHWF
jgi:hypothetical protein